MTGNELPSDRDFPAGRFAVRRDHLMAEIAPESKRRRMSRRVRWISGISVGLVLAGGGFATAATQMHLWGGGGAKVTGQSACYTDRSADPDKSGLTAVVLHGEDPVQRCASEWEQGNVVEGVHRAPSLVACQNGHGIVAAFPGKEGSCGEMGLKPPRPVSSAERARTQAVARLQTDLQKHFGTCVHKRDRKSVV